MASMLPIALYGLEIPPGEIMVPAAIEAPATIRITMAAIDPTEAPETDKDGNVPSVLRSTLKLIKSRVHVDSDDEEDDELDDDALEQLLGNGPDDDEDEEDEAEEEQGDDEPNGGPSDPARSKKARQEAAIKKLLESTQDESSDDDMEDADAKPNGVKSKKGKKKASDEDEDDEEDDEDYEDDVDMEEFVLCTLDTERNYQQPIDITIGEGEKAFFIVTGTHAIHLTGNYVIPDIDDEDDEDEDEEDYFPPNLAEYAADEESDELDDVDAVPRITEVDTDDEKPPKLTADKKENKKRPAEDEPEGLDEMIAKDEAKLSKKQLKKLKNNKGEAVSSEKKSEKSDAKETPTGKGDKKVQFAKNLEQGPSGPVKDQPKKAKDQSAGLGVKVVQGVTIDDRKIGTGRTVKAGDKVGLRYIGKLPDGKVFDSNKKGPPFSFKVGKGEVIKGWDIGIVGMSIGGERRLTIPPHLAYGSKALPGIPANSTLAFDVKLLEIK